MKEAFVNTYILFLLVYKDRFAQKSLQKLCFSKFIFFYVDTKKEGM